MRKKQNTLHHPKKILFFCIITLIIIGSVIAHAQVTVQKKAQFWNIQSIDTMKYSRDPSRDPNIYNIIPFLVKNVADLHATHIAIATPYDEEFYPVLKAWVDESRKYGLKIWFRGNFSEWEGWFGYTKFTDINEHTRLTKAFILKHTDLFQNNDIFTPVPEAENGGMGDPRGSDEKTKQFNEFLVSSYQNCIESFRHIHKTVACGYFSMNGDIAKSVLTPETVRKTGQIVVIDHYVNTPEKMSADIEYLSNKFSVAKIVLGEYGAPIPDINGDMSETEQANFINSLLKVFVMERDKITGINYWDISGGSTALFNDDGSPRKASQVVKNFYDPPMIKGVVKDELGEVISGVTVKTTDGISITTSDPHGNYFLTAIPSSPVTLSAQRDGFNKSIQTVILSADSKEIIQDITISPQNIDFYYKIRLFIKNIFKL